MTPAGSRSAGSHYHEQAQINQVSAAMEKHAILIVEDDPDVAELLSTFFSSFDYTVHHAAWGADALKIAREHLFSLIMLDIRLPDISGYEVCRQLRTQRRTQDVPILFLTEKRDRVDKLQGLELGVVDYITKPFDILELQLRVRNAIQRASQKNLINPITELPDTHLVDEKLSALIGDQHPWALIVLEVHGMDKLREMYGFVAADDMLRAITMIARNSVREHGSEGDFIGHLGPEQLIIFTHASRVAPIRQRAETRIRYSLETFYRPKDDAAPAEQDSFMTLSVGVLDASQGPFASLDELRARLSALTAWPPASVD